MKSKILYLFLPVPIIIVSFFLVTKEDYVIYPVENSLMNCYSDKNAHSDGKTEMPAFLNTQEGLEVRFNLREGYNYPYAGIMFVPDSNKSALLADYNNLQIEIKSHKSRSLKFILLVSYSHKNSSDLIYPDRYLEKEVDIDGNFYNVNLKDFQTPSWWFRKNKVTEKEAGPVLNAKVKAFLIQSGNHTPLREDEILEIQSIVLSSNATYFWLYVSVISVIYYLTLFIIKRRSSKSVILPYKKLSISGNPEEEKLFDYLSSNYQDPDLSIEKLNQELGIPVTKIPILIKNKTGLNFKQYLNAIRMQEAKRLLSETDQQIVQISYAVGYNTVTHFNKVFRQMENISPKEYRIKNKMSEEKI